jgi:hypothetical protein
MSGHDAADLLAVKPHPDHSIGLPIRAARHNRSRAWLNIGQQLLVHPATSPPASAIILPAEGVSTKPGSVHHALQRAGRHGRFDNL